MVYLIYGPPCGGKSTYIKEHLSRGDVVCDIDLIYSAISGDDEHDADLYIHDIAKRVTRSLLDIIRDRDGIKKDVYVVSLANTKEKLEKAKERVNADECIFIDTPYETCMERAKERPFYFQWIIQEWFQMSDFNNNKE